MKLPFIGPDIEQAISHTLFLTFLHNFVPFFLGLACLISLIWLIALPSRPRIFLLIGFVLLLMEFEFKKHIMQPLIDQTLLTLTTETPRYTFQWIVEKSITRIIPLMLLLGGWISLIGSLIVLFREYRNEKLVMSKND